MVHFVLCLSIEPCKSSIYPFQELKRPLQFLGLYDTTLCNVTHIPAYKVLDILSVIMTFFSFFSDLTR